MRHAGMDDCIIVGAGPAGLTAAIYLSRFHLRIRLFDCGSSRAALIPCTHNHAGFPEGIAGIDLLARMRAQAERYGAVREAVRVDRLIPTTTGFVVETASGDHFDARTVLLATGVVNNRPAIPDALHDEALARGMIRYCPICDGYEVTDRRVGVIGTRVHAMREALFLRSYTRDLTLIAPDGVQELDDECRRTLTASGVRIVDGPCDNYAIEDGRLAFDTSEGRMVFDSVYPAMGSRIRSELAIAAGAVATAEGTLEVDDHQRTSVPGLFAAGDVVKGLDQISHAMGEAGVAATTIRNRLSEEHPLSR